MDGWYGWVVLRIYIAFTSNLYLEAEDPQSLELSWRDQDLNPGPFARQAKSFTLCKLHNWTLLTLKRWEWVIHINILSRNVQNMYLHYVWTILLL